MPNYTVTLTREVTDLLAASISVTATTEAEAISQARAFWESGDVELRFANQVAAGELEFNATLNPLAP